MPDAKVPTCAYGALIARHNSIGTIAATPAAEWPGFAAGCALKAPWWILCPWT
jgi:hypothetical protein